MNYFVKIILILCLFVLQFPVKCFSVEKSTFESWRISTVDVDVENQLGSDEEIDISYLFTTSAYDNIRNLNKLDSAFYKRVAEIKKDLVFKQSNTRPWPIGEVINLYPIKNDYFILETIWDGDIHSLSLFNIHDPEIIYSSNYGSTAGGNVWTNWWKDNSLLGIVTPNHTQIETAYFYFPPQKDAPPVTFNIESIERYAGIDLKNNNEETPCEFSEFNLEKHGIQLLDYKECDYYSNMVCTDGVCLHNNKIHANTKHFIPWKEIIGPDYKFIESTPIDRCRKKKFSPDKKIIIKCKADAGIFFEITDTRGRNLFNTWKIENANFFADGIWILAKDESVGSRFFFANHQEFIERRINEIELPYDAKAIGNIQQIGDSDFLLSTPDALFMLSLKNKSLKKFLIRKPPTRNSNDEFINNLIGSYPQILNRLCLKEILTKDLELYLWAQSESKSPKDTNIFNFIFSSNFPDGESDMSDFSTSLYPCGIKAFPKTSFLPDDKKILSEVNREMYLLGLTLFEIQFTWWREWIFFKNSDDAQWTGAWRVELGEYVVAERFANISDSGGGLDRVMRIHIRQDPFGDKPSHWHNE